MNTGESFLGIVTTCGTHRTAEAVIVSATSTGIGVLQVSSNLLLSQTIKTAKTMAEKKAFTFTVDELELVSLLREEGRGAFEGEVDVNWDPEKYLKLVAVPY